jgi:hypothetical protein
MPCLVLVRGWERHCSVLRGERGDDNDGYCGLVLWGKRERGEDEREDNEGQARQGMTGLIDWRFAPNVGYPDFCVVVDDGGVYIHGGGLGFF